MDRSACYGSVVGHMTLHVNRLTLEVEMKVSGSESHLGPLLSLDTAI